jgi:type VI secretion system secreted protein VgrG
VSSPWAGKNWGAISIPRIGQEVIVDFLEGDPDQPIITGRVYNAEQMPPYALPANMTQSGIKSRSSLGGSPDNFNELRFEDKKGSEQVYIHAERNQDIVVESDETHSVGHDRKKTVGHDETIHIKHDRTETVDNNQKTTVGVNRTEVIGGSHSEEIGGTMSLTVKLAKNELVYLASSEEVGLARNLTVGGAYTIEVVGAMNEAILGAKAVEVGLAHVETAGRDRKLNVGKNLTIDAGDSIEIKTGAASLVMKKDGKIEISGVDVTLKSSAGTINIDAGGIIAIKGPMVKINT